MNSILIYPLHSGLFYYVRISQSKGLYYQHNFIPDIENELGFRRPKGSEKRLTDDNDDDDDDEDQPDDGENRKAKSKEKSLLLHVIKSFKSRQFTV